MFTKTIFSLIALFIFQFGYGVNSNFFDNTINFKEFKAEFDALDLPLDNKMASDSTYLLNRKEQLEYSLHLTSVVMFLEQDLENRHLFVQKDFYIMKDIFIVHLKELLNVQQVRKKLFPQLVQNITDFKKDIESLDYLTFREESCRIIFNVLYKLLFLQAAIIINVLVEQAV